MRVIAVLAAMAGSPGPSVPAIRNIELEGLRGRLFPVLSHLDPSPVKAMLAQRAARTRACAEKPACIVAADIWTGPEIEMMASVARDSKAVRIELAGLNSVLKVYGLGEAPRYPEIDGPELGDRAVFDTDVATAVRMTSNAPPQIDRSLTLSLDLLDVADRLDAVSRLAESEDVNRAALSRSAHMAWADYPYAAVVALGVGPDDMETPLSARGKRNVEMAAALYFDHRAPFIIVSGGSVHPRRTRFVEAYEMRKALIERYGVPAGAILVDPFARHTTTNLRNASRLLLRLRIPADKAALVVSNEAQIAYVVGAEFKSRNLEVLGYEPAALEAPTSATTVPFRPNPASRQVDPGDPLDP